MKNTALNDHNICTCETFQTTKDAVLHAGSHHAVLGGIDRKSQLIEKSIGDIAHAMHMRYQALVERGNVGVVESDANAVFTYVNRKFAELVGCIPEEMVGRSMFDFMTPEQTEITKNRLQQRRQGQVDTYMGTLLTKGGVPVWVQIAASPLPVNSSGQYQGALAVVIDIHERKMLEGELKSRDRIEEKLAEVEPRLARLRKESTRLIEESRRIEQQGYTYAKPTYRQGKYLVLVHQKEKGGRKREYIGSDEEAITQALSKVARGMQHRTLLLKQENIEKRLRNAVFKLDQVLETITPSVFEQF